MKVKVTDRRGNESVGGDLMQLKKKKKKKGKRRSNMRRRKNSCMNFNDDDDDRGLPSHTRTKKGPYSFRVVRVQKSLPFSEIFLFICHESLFLCYVMCYAIHSCKVDLTGSE